MPTGWYTRRRAENGFRPQQAQPHGQMAVQWLTWESYRTGHSIRHQANGREKRIGKLPVDGWCAEIRTAYQFHGCYFHGCPKCHTDPKKINAVNKKTMGELLKNTLLKWSKCGNVGGKRNGSKRTPSDLLTMNFHADLNGR